MSPAKLTIVVTPKFMDRVLAVEQYLGRVVAARGWEISSAIIDFAHYYRGGHFRKLTRFTRFSSIPGANTL